MAEKAEVLLTATDATQGIVGKLSQRTAITVDMLSAYRHVAKLSDVSNEGMTKNLQTPATPT
jgi:hypothetical protein